MFFNLKMAARIDSFQVSHSSNQFKKYNLVPGMYVLCAYEK